MIDFFIKDNKILNPLIPFYAYECPSATQDKRNYADACLSYPREMVTWCWILKFLYSWTAQVHYKADGVRLHQTHDSTLMMVDKVPIPVLIPSFWSLSFTEYHFQDRNRAPTMSQKIWAYILYLELIKIS